MQQRAKLHLQNQRCSREKHFYMQRTSLEPNSDKLPGLPPPKRCYCKSTLCFCACACLCTFLRQKRNWSQMYRSRAEEKEDILMSSILPTGFSEVDKIKSNSSAIVSCYHSPIDHRVSLFKQRCLRKSWGRVSLGLHSQYYSHDRTSVWCEQLTTEMQQTLAKYRLINVANGW